MGNTPNIRFKGYTDDWEQRKVGEIFTERTERANGDEELLSVTISNGVIKQADSVKRNIASEDKSNYKVVKVGDLPYNSMRMWQGALGTSEYNGIVSPAYTVLVPSEDANAKFFMELFKKESSLQIFTRWSQGLTSDTWNLKFPLLSEIKFLIPIVEEQTKMGEYFKRLDNLISLHQRKCDETKELKKYMLQKMFPQNGEKIPEIRFEGFTDDWEQRRLGEYCNLITKGTTPSKFNDCGLITFVKIEALSGKRIIKTLCTGIDEDIHRGELARSVLEKNDIVFAIAGATLGKCAIVTEDILPANTNQALAILRLNNNIDRAFVYFSLTSIAMESYIKQIKSVGAQPNLSLEQMRNYRFPCPVNQEEQRKIGEYFDTLDSLITLHQRKCDELKEVKKYMLQNMFPQKG